MKENRKSSSMGERIAGGGDRVKSAPRKTSNESDLINVQPLDSSVPNGTWAVREDSQR
jgi:hypothetical protein